MTSFYIVLKVLAFIAIIIVPLAGPKRKKNIAQAGTSNLAVNGEGFLEVIVPTSHNHHQVH